MINIKELRIGDFVITNNSKYRTEHVGKVACITQIDSERHFEEIKGTVSLYLIDDEWKDTYGQWLKDIKLIPITEEWLFKFGFERTYLSQFRSKFTHKDTHCIGYDFSYVIDKSMEGFTWYGRYVKDIKYINQLQNLYFILTGEELTLSVT